jgi:SAM-dependent methyltransferase
LTDNRNTDQTPEMLLGRPSPARMYDYFLGGENNFAVDRAAADEIRKAIPNAPVLAWENRQFLRRAVRHLIEEAGIRQFLDIGAGLPTVGNVHEIAHHLDPDIHVVYVDNDPLVAVHGGSLLAGMEDTTTMLTEDLRDIDSILQHPRTRRLLDFTQPIGILLAAVLHFIPDTDDPARIIASIRDAVAPGSHLVLSHGVIDGATDEARALVSDVYRQSTTTQAAAQRSTAQVRGFFDGWELLDPGVVPIHQWRPATQGPLGGGGLVAGVGRRP